VPVGRSDGRERWRKSLDALVSAWKLDQHQVRACLRDAALALRQCGALGYVVDSQAALAVAVRRNFAVDTATLARRITELVSDLRTICFRRRETDGHLAPEERRFAQRIESALPLRRTTKQRPETLRQIAEGFGDIW